jgi:hypothetical protein
VLDAKNHIRRRALIRRARADVERRFAWPAVMADYRRLLGLA